MRLARAHNDANILALGARFPGEDPVALVDAFLETAFEGGRHARRVAKIGAIETRRLPRYRNRRQSRMTIDENDGPAFGRG